MSGITVTALSPRQRAIAALIADGLTNQAIGQALGISANTVKNHITAIFRQLGTTSRTQVARRIWETEHGDAGHQRVSVAIEARAADIDEAGGCGVGRGEHEHPARHRARRPAARREPARPAADALRPGGFREPWEG